MWSISLFCHIEVEPGKEGIFHICVHICIKENIDWSLQKILESKSPPWSHSNKRYICQPYTLDGHFYNSWSDGAILFEDLAIPYS